MSLVAESKCNKMQPPKNRRRRSCRVAIASLISSALLLGSGADGFATHSSAQIASPRQLRFSSKGMVVLGSSIDRENDVANRAIEDGPSEVLPPEDSRKETPLPISALLSALTGGGPPLHVDDTQLLIYDVLLILNLSVSISLFVVHRMNFTYIATSLNEGALLCICWILAGLANGAFLSSAVDGHYDPLGRDSGKGGPNAAGLLGLSTFVSTSSIRIVVALMVAVLQHRPVGSGGEELIPLEILFGLVLMSLWRAMHSYITPRI